MLLNSISNYDYFLVELPNDIQVLWNGIALVHIDVKDISKITQGGLCGLYHNVQGSPPVTSLANKWKSDTSCKDIAEEDNKHTCEVNKEKKPIAEKHCKKMKSDIFKGRPNQKTHFCKLLKIKV